MLRRRSLCLLVIGAVLVTGCSGAGGDRPPSPSRGAEGHDLGEPPVNWDSPLLDGVNLSSLQAAQPNLPFTPVAPRFGAPDVIQIDDPAQVQPTDQTLALVFHLQDYGTVLVEERSPGDWSLAQMQARADDPSAPPDAFQMVPVRNTSGLLIQGDGVGRVIWIEKGILFDITGPAVAPQQVLKLAEGL